MRLHACSEAPAAQKDRYAGRGAGEGDVCSPRLAEAEGCQLLQHHSKLPCWNWRGSGRDLAQVESLVDAIFEEQGDTHGSVQIPSEDHGTMSQLNNSAAECAWALDSERVAPRSERKDVIERGLLSIGTARQLVELYMTEMYPVYPIVYLDPACTAVGYFYR